LPSDPLFPESLAHQHHLLRLTVRRCAFSITSTTSAIQAPKTMSRRHYKEEGFTSMLVNTGRLGQKVGRTNICTLKNRSIRCTRGQPLFQKFVWSWSLQIWRGESYACIDLRYIEERMRRTTDVYSRLVCLTFVDTRVLQCA
jgi:hypothetical protein